MPYTQPKLEASDKSARENIRKQDLQAICTPIQLWLILLHHFIWLFHESRKIEKFLHLVLRPNTYQMAYHVRLHSRSLWTKLFTLSQSTRTTTERNSKIDFTVKLNCLTRAAPSKSRHSTFLTCKLASRYSNSILRQYFLENILLYFTFEMVLHLPLYTTRLSDCKACEKPSPFSPHV